MSGELRALRVELADTITGINTYTHLPGRAVLPCVWILAGSPYLQQADTFGSQTVRHQVVIAAQTGPNDAETDELDRLIESVLHDLAEADYLVERVDQPISQNLNGQEILAVPITVAGTIPALT